LGEPEIIPGTDILLLLLAALILFAMNTAAPAATLYKLFFGAAIATGFFLLFIIRKKLPADTIAVMKKPFNFYSTGLAPAVMHFIYCITRY
jgi:hypothetical protein